jgi:hypothetical protein
MKEIKRWLSMPWLYVIVFVLHLIAIAIIILGKPDRQLSLDDWINAAFTVVFWGALTVLGYCTGWTLADVVIHLIRFVKSKKVDDDHL